MIKLVKLGELATFSQGQQIPIPLQNTEKFEGCDTFLRIINYTQNTDDFRYVPKQNPKYLVNKEDIVMVRYGAVGFVGRGLSGVLANNLFKVNYKKELVNGDFLYRVLWSDQVQKQLLNASQSTSMAALNFTSVAKIIIPLPPLDQQKKIASILDAADAYRQKTKALISKYDELTQSLFLDMFGDPVKNEKGWEVKTIEAITKKEKGAIKRGPFGGALKKEIFVEEGYLVYEQYHALNNDFSFERYYINEEKFQELKGFEVKPGDIIVSCSGVYLGKLAIIPNGAKKGIINQALLKLTLDQSKMTNHFFTFHFSQKSFRETFFDANRGAGIPNFPPISDFKRFPFISPPIDLQTQFAERVQAIEQQKAKAQESLDKAEELFNSLLQKAFKGELV